MEMAMAGSRMVRLESLRSFCGDRQLRGFVGKGMRFSDRSHEMFYALHVRCGKKKRNLAGSLAKVQSELVEMQRNLVLLSQSALTHHGVGESVADFESEASIRIGLSDPNVSHFIVDRIMKNLEDLQAEVESLNVKATKKKGGSFSSSSSSSESSDNDTMGKAVTMRALRQRKNSAKHTGPAAVPTPALPLYHWAEQNPTEMASVVSTVDCTGEEEPAIVALCSTANFATSVTTSAICRRGPIELEDIPSGRVIVDTPSSSLPSPDVPEVGTGSVIEVCTGGKCKRGGSHQILASLQGCIPEGSDVSVTSCKCMGKCKSAPNMRVKGSEGQTSQVYSNVSVDDVDALLELHFGVQLKSSASQSSGMSVLLARVDSGVAAA